MPRRKKIALAGIAALALAGLLASSSSPAGAQGFSTHDCKYYGRCYPLNEYRGYYAGPMRQPPAVPAPQPGPPAGFNACGHSAGC